MKEESTLEYNGQKIPFVIIHEKRRSVRVAFGAKAITLRLPAAMANVKKLQHIEQSRDWAVKQLRLKPGLLTKFFGREYKHGDILQVGSRQYFISFLHHDRKTNRALLKGNLLELHLSSENKEDQQAEILRYLISRAISNDFYPEIEKRVHELNAKYFKKNIKEIKIKLSQTNWGSCSTQGNINLSARLLFAPSIVIDYVIIHELAHMLEHNHSARFWAVVSKVMPDYEIHDKWLNKNSHLCDF